MSFYKTFTIKDTIVSISDSIRLVSKPLYIIFCAIHPTLKGVGFSHSFQVNLTLLVVHFLIGSTSPNIFLLTLNGSESPDFKVLHYGRSSPDFKVLHYTDESPNSS